MLTHWLEQLFDAHMGKSEGATTNREEYLDTYKTAFITQQFHFPDEAETLPNEENYHTIFPWFPSDTKEEFDKQMSNPGTKGLLEKFGWADAEGNAKPIAYKMNDYGFRCKQFSDAPGIISLGCSMTFGIGLSEEHTWPGIISKSTGLENWNLGCPGKGLDFITPFLRFFIKEELPNTKAICVFLPPIGRKTMWIDAEIEPGKKELVGANLHGMEWMHEPYITGPLPSPDYEDYQRNIVDPEALLLNSIWKRQNALHHEIGQLAIIESIANEMDIPLIVIGPMYCSAFEEQRDLARDLLHPGPLNNKLMAEKFLLNLELDLSDK
jgi:hypothetical protein